MLSLVYRERRGITMSTKPHSREKRVVNKTVRVEKKDLNSNKTNNNESILKKLFGLFIKK